MPKFNGDLICVLSLSLDVTESPHKRSSYDFTGLLLFLTIRDMNFVLSHLRDWTLQ